MPTSRDLSLLHRRIASPSSGGREMGLEVEARAHYSSPIEALHRWYRPMPALDGWAVPAACRETHHGSYLPSSCRRVGAAVRSSGAVGSFGTSLGWRWPAPMIWSTHLFHGLPFDLRKAPDGAAALDPSLDPCQRQIPFEVLFAGTGLSIHPAGDGRPTRRCYSVPTPALGLAYDAPRVCRGSAQCLRRP